MARSGFGDDIDCTECSFGAETAAYYNNFHGLEGDFSEMGRNIDVDPHYVDTASYDFRLRFDSPVIDRGTVLIPEPGLPETDLIGNPRVTGTAPDLGAYEYHTWRLPHWGWSK